MNYSEALEYLKEVQEKRLKLSIFSIQKIINNLPFNLKNIKFIQVAGTNGKGSTSHFITSILQSAGYKTGLFTSPHLQDIRERITVNKEWISKTDFSECLSIIRGISLDLLKKGLIDNMPTFFEHIFLTSIYYFYREEADFVVLEVGLGGRLDATSTITPEVSVITNISYDHTKTLGKRLRDIAFEKAGIIKENIPVVCGCGIHTVSNRIIKEIALKKRADFYNVINSKNKLEVKERRNYYLCNFKTESGKYVFKVRLNGSHQGKNASTAIKAIEILNSKGYGISKKSICDGIFKNFVPGRIEIINSSPQVILDGGHNVESIRALKNFLSQKRKKDLTLIFGVLRDKNFKRMISLLLPFTKNIVVTEPVSKRAMPAEKLIKFFDNKRIFLNKDPGEALKTAKKFREDILITGSLYLAGEMRNIINGG